MTLTVLTDEQVVGLLDNLTLDEAETFVDVLRQALHQYSTGTQAVEAGDIQQPPRTSVTTATTGATTVFVPSVSTVARGGVGMKVVTLAAPRRDGDNDGNGNNQMTTPHATGAITLYDGVTGEAVGMLSVRTLTAFRTALASVSLLQRRDTVRNLTVFGCGEQAYWHVRLALLFRGSTIRRVHVVSRRFSASCKLILQRFYQSPAVRKAREGWADTQFTVLTPGYGEYPRLLAQNLRSSDVVYCCTPSTEPLFDAAVLTSHDGRRKGRLIVAVGSYTQAMHELPADLLLQATKPDRPHHHHYHKHAVEGGVVVVDTLDGALKESGEIIAAGLNPRQLVELGELVMLSRKDFDDEDNDNNNDNDNDDVSSPSSLNVPPSADFDKLDLSGPTSPLSPLSPSSPLPSPSLSSVFGFGSSGSSRDASNSTITTTGSSTANSSPASSRTASPMRSRDRRENREHHSQPSLHRRSASQMSVDRRRKKEDHMARWLQQGNVIYKSVGLGLMDLTVGMHLIGFAAEKGVGTRIKGF